MAAATGAISIQDETGVVQLAGTATFPDGLTVSDVETPDVATGNSDPITIKTGDAATGNGGDITIEGGDGDPGSGTGGSVNIQPGDGDSQGGVIIRAASGDARVNVSGVLIELLGEVHALTTDGDLALTTDSGGAGSPAIGFLGAGPTLRQTITGALSAVTDAAAKDVLTSIIAALDTLGLTTDGTT